MLIGHWPLNGTTRDIVGGNHGTEYNTSISGDITKTYDFDGSTSYISIDNTNLNADYPFGGNCSDLSLSMWIYPEAFSTLTSNHNTANNLFANSSTSFDDNFELGIRENQIDVYTELRGDAYETGDRTVNPSAQFSINKWYNIILTKSQNNGLKIYKDGIEIFHDSEQKGSFNDEGFNLTIGKNGHQETFFNGRISDVRLFNHEITISEIELLSSGKILHYKFEQGNDFFDFEDATSQGWTFTDSSFGIRSDQSYSGTYSIGANKTDAPIDLAYYELDQAEKIYLFEFYWYEIHDSHGGGIALEDENGNEILGIATDNHEWNIHDKAGWTEIADNTISAYENWILFRVTFDWVDGKYTYHFEDTVTSDVRSGTRDLIKNTNVKTIKIKNQNAESWIISNFYMWFDNIKIVKNLKDYSIGNDNTFSSNENTFPTMSGDYVLGKHSYYFDGVDDYMPLDMFCDKSIYEMTVIAWVKIPSDGGDWSVVDFDRSEFFTCAVGIPSGSISTEGDYVGFHTVSEDMWSNSTIRDNQWHHVTWIFNSSDSYDKKIFIDGNLDAQVNHHGGSPLGDITVPRYGFIGDGSEASGYDGSKNHKYYKGYINDLIVYRRALTQQEIQKQMDLKRRYFIDEKENFFCYISKKSTGSKLYNNGLLEYGPKFNKNIIEGL